jgi:hypothetical protein
MERLFSMLDINGEQAVSHKELLVGIAPMIDAEDEAKITCEFIYPPVAIRHLTHIPLLLYTY